MPLQFLEVGFHVKIHAIEWHDFERDTQFHGVVVTRIEFSLYTNLWFQFNKVQQGSPKYKRIALSLFAARPRPPGFMSAPMRLRSSALGPRPSVCPPNRHSTVRLPPPDLPISATATPPVVDRSRLAALVPTPQHQHEGGRH